EQGPRLADDRGARDEYRLARARAPRRAAGKGSPWGAPHLVRLPRRGERRGRDREGPGSAAAEAELAEATTRPSLALPQPRGEDLSLLAMLRDGPAGQDDPVLAAHL